MPSDDNQNHRERRKMTFRCHQSFSRFIAAVGLYFRTQDQREWWMFDSGDKR